jgi:ABC-type transporter Mla subunit MlaD
MSEFDDTLTQLFAEARQSLPAEEFLRSVATALDQARRQRAIRRAVLTLAAAAVAVAATPYVAAGSLAVASHFGKWLPPLADSLASPVVWLCAVAVAAWGKWKMRFR